MRGRSVLVLRRRLMLRRGFLRRFPLFVRGFLRSFVTLAVEEDFGNLHSREWLPVSGELLVLLLALVMENQNLFGASLFEHLADDARATIFRARNLSFAGAGRQNVRKFEFAVLSRLALNVDHVSGRDTILL